jgi:hypothetical protein
MAKGRSIIERGNEPQDAAVATPKPQYSGRLFWLAIAGFVVIGTIINIPNYIQKWLWMGTLHYDGVFWTLLSVRWLMFGIGFSCAFLYLWINLRLALRISLSDSQHPSKSRSAIREAHIAQMATPQVFRIAPSIQILSIALIALSLTIALFFAAEFYAQWERYIRIRYGGEFGVSDPLYGLDIGFYVFSLPFYMLLQTASTYLTGITVLAVGTLYTRFGLIQLGWKTRSQPKAASHISALLCVVVAVWGWGFYLDHYNLVYSTLGVVYGAGYTADHVTRNALWTMVGASSLACGLLAISSLRSQIRALVPGFSAYLSLYVISIILTPLFFQKYVVQPNELALETPYLAKYIKSTRNAYHLDTIHETSYPGLSELTPAAVAKNQDTIRNIRLWDTRPLLQTYHQTQALRLYYQFYNVDTDRYFLKDGYHQVMLATRELTPDLPSPAQTWVNQYLQFTHGYGVVMNFVSKTVGDGLPLYILKDIPATSDYGLSITQPSIYYGESTPGYRIVATGIKEFDFPKGNDNIYSHYAGEGGILLNSFWKKLLFAWTQGDINILLTSYLQPRSRIQIWRRVHERVAQIAPFLRLDRDPYPVLSGGKLYWVQDAYTVSNYFPYATPVRTHTWTSTPGSASRPDTGENEGSGAVTFEDGLNYIRNSVKVLVDMYEGTVTFYVMDTRDPILAAYRHAFPDLFKNLTTLPEDLKKHLRYPRDLFAIQSEQYKTFHMTDPQVFYNREDLWELPMERYGGELWSMQPYYILMKLPGTDELQYLLMTPFTPQRRDNMIAWMAAKSDFPNYGKILFYELPKEKLIYGPKQIDAMIDQNTTISRQLTLWDQRGSRVIRGKQIVAPIDNSFLYVVPLYLTAAGTSFPQLKRIIVASGDKVVMAPTLDEAVNGLFAPLQPPVGATQNPERPINGAGEVPIATLDQARRRLQEAQNAIKEGDWGKFGKVMQELQRDLSERPD